MSLPTLRYHGPNAAGHFLFSLGEPVPEPFKTFAEARQHFGRGAVDRARADYQTSVNDRASGRILIKPGRAR